MLLLPTAKNPTRVEPFDERRKLFETLEASQEWGRKANIETVGDLNDQICSGSMSELILVQEAGAGAENRRAGEDDCGKGQCKICHDSQVLPPPEKPAFPTGCPFSFGHLEKLPIR